MYVPSLYNIFVSFILKMLLLVLFSLPSQTEGLSPTAEVKQFETAHDLGVTTLKSNYALIIIRIQKLLRKDV